MKLLRFAALFALTAVSVAAAETRESAFWNWFVKHEARVFAFEKDQERVFDELAAELAKVHPDLSFEFSSIRADRRRQFVISASGLKQAFPAVETLAAAAPKLDRWIVVKFRPRRDPPSDLDFGGKTIRAADVHFMLLPDSRPGKVGIALFIDGYRDSQPVYRQIGYLMLDEALGEYDVETKVGGILMQGREVPEFAQARPLTTLAREFDAHFAKTAK